MKATVKCNVVGGKSTIPSCRIWDNNKKNPDVCTTAVQAGTGSKCDCSPITVSAGDIGFGTLTVIKKLDPTNDPGKFNLLIDDVQNATDVGHNGTTGAVTVNAGSHTVSETAGTGTNLTDYDATGVCTNGTYPNATVTAGQNTTCTITNKSKAVPVCRIVRLTSSTSVTPPGSVLLGTGLLKGTCSGTSCLLTLNTNDGMFSGKGLIYNNGQFPVSNACNGPAEECFPTQSTTSPSASPFPTTSPGFNLTDLKLLAASGGGTILFTSGTAYSYTGGKFGANAGTYLTTDCTNAVPEPGTLVLVLPLVLVLLSLAGLGLARRRQARQRSGPTAARIH